MPRLLAALVVALFVSGCRAFPAARRSTFKQAQYEPYAAEGTAKILGQAFATTKGGDVKFAAGRTVNVNPVTEYSTEWWDRTVLGGEELLKADSRVEPFHRSTTTDAEGRFEIDNLPAGEYYVVTEVEWQYGGYDFEKSGVILARRIQVKDGQTVKTVLEPVR